MDIKSNEHVVLKTWLEVSCKISNDLKKIQSFSVELRRLKKLKYFR